MITVNSLSGGKTSSYIAANYPADYNVFALVRTSDKNCLFPDEKIRQIVSDKLGTEFIGTLEDDTIIYTMLDLEQYIGKKIDWVTGKTFDEVIIKTRNGNNVTWLPQSNKRFCTTEMKLQPIFDWWKKEINQVCDMRIGFRANEMRRAKKMIDKLNKDGNSTFNAIIGKSKNGNRNKWEDVAWRKPTFPLIEDSIFKDKIETYWKDKSVRFAWVNNCVGCMGATPYYLKHQYKKNKNKIEWFLKQEEKCLKDYGLTWRIDRLTYKEIIEHKQQFEMFDEDFNSCDGGGCGL
jgi:hypothetical protein